MKTKNIILLLLLSMVFISISCTDGFERYNDDPNRVDENDYDFSAADLGSALRFGSNMNYMADNGLAGGGHLFERVKNLGTEIWAQYNAGEGVPANGWVEDYWKADYGTWLSLLNGVIRDASMYEGRENTMAVALIWRAFIHTNVSDYFGPMPFSFDPLDENPDYMSLDVMYKGFFDDLDKALGLFDPSKNMIVKEDFIFGGDINKWKKFANSLRLRLAIKLSEIDPALAKTQMLAALVSEAGGVIGQGDDALAIWYDGWANGSAYGELSWNTYNMTTSMEKALTGIGGMEFPSGVATGVHPVQIDPRGLLMFDPSSTDSDWKGMNVAPIASGLAAVTAKMSSIFKADNKRSMNLLSYTETCFLLAEAVERNFVSSSDANGTAQEWYEKGVRSSFDRWGIANKTDAYLNSTAKNTWGTSAKYSDGTSNSGNTNLEKIVTQRYIAFYPDLSGQVWNDKRRLNLPAMDIPEVQDDGAGNWPKDKSIKNPANYAQRALYPQSENLLNKDKYQAGVAQIGGADKQTSVLWWASEKSNYCTSEN